MPHIFSNISLIAKYGVICSQLFRFSRLCSSNISFIIQSCRLILLRVEKGYSFKKILKMVCSFLTSSKFIFGIPHLIMFFVFPQKDSSISLEKNAHRVTLPLGAQMYKGGNICPTHPPYIRWICLLDGKRGWGGEEPRRWSIAPAHWSSRSGQKRPFSP